MSISKLKNIANAPMFSEVTTADDLAEIKKLAPGLFKKPYKRITFGDEDKATSNFFGIQHFWSDLKYPLYYVAEIFK